MQPLAQLLGVVLALRAAPARDDGARRGDAGQAGEADSFQGTAHPCVGYGPCRTRP